MASLRVSLCDIDLVLHLGQAPPEGEHRQDEKSEDRGNDRLNPHHDAEERHELKNLRTDRNYGQDKLQEVTPSVLSAPHDDVVVLW